MPRRVVFRKYGSSEALETELFASRALGPGELRVEVAYAGVNYADVLARRGFYKWAPPLPTCVGFELAGVVSEVGPGVSSHAVGDRVVAITRFGGYADEVVLEARRAWKLPAHGKLDEAAAIPAVTITAWHALCEVARVRSGESVLIQAVAGGVGLAALHIAKHLGLTTYGTASSADKLAFAAEHGLDHGIDYTRTDFEREVSRLTAGRGVDCVLDSLGGEGLRKGYRCLARGGMVVTIGAAQVAPESKSPFALLKAGIELARGGVFHPFQLIEHNRGMAGVQVLLLWDDLARLDRGMSEILAWWQEGVLAPHVDRVFPLEAASEAHAHLESRRSRGKLLLRCAGADGA
jgi:NADPH:quinone reductase-like Zn-dependent oxidoreductase